MADAAHYRELDFSAMKKHGTSYRILPDDYQKPTCSGRGPLEQRAALSGQQREALGDRVDALVERADLVGSGGIEVPMGPPSEGVEAEPLA